MDAKPGKSGKSCKSVELGTKSGKSAEAVDLKTGSKTVDLESGVQLGAESMESVESPSRTGAEDLTTITGPADLARATGPADLATRTGQLGSRSRSWSRQLGRRNRTGQLDHRSWIQ